MEEFEVAWEVLPESATVDEIREMAGFQWIYVPLNLAEFLAYHSVANILEMAALIAILHWGLHLRHNSAKRPLCYWNAG